MSTLRIKVTTGKAEFTVAPDDTERLIKVSYEYRSVPRIGTVLIEDLLRTNNPDLSPLLETFESSKVPCNVSLPGDFYCGGVAYELPVYFLLHEDGYIEMRGPI